MAIHPASRVVEGGRVAGRHRGGNENAQIRRLALDLPVFPGQLEGALAVARAALDAREFPTARAALAPYVSAPTRRVATLMARSSPRLIHDNTRHGVQWRTSQAPQKRFAPT